MFFRAEKEIKKIEKEKVSCNECKCLLYVEDAQKVVCPLYSEFYCRKCEKPYSRKSFNRYGLIYFKEIEVDERGLPVGYKKIK